MSKPSKHHPHSGSKRHRPPEPYRIEVHLRAKKMRVIADGKVVLEFHPIGGGRPGHPTPLGPFHVTKTDEHHHSSKYKDHGQPAKMPYSVFFTDGVAFHAGNPASPSHGCIHMQHDDAKALFDWVETNRTSHPIGVDVSQ